MAIRILRKRSHLIGKRENTEMREKSFIKEKELEMGRILTERKQQELNIKHVATVKE